MVEYKNEEINSRMLARVALESRIFMKNPSHKSEH